MPMLRSQVQSRTRHPGVDVVLRRLRGRGACSPELTAQVEALGDRVERIAAGAVLQVEGDLAARPRYLLDGWAYRFRDLPDGRRQIFDFVLPGEGVGVCLRPHASAATTMTLTPVVLGDAGALTAKGGGDASREHAELAQMAAEDDERRLLGALLRLGRMSALERLANLLLELEARLSVGGLATPTGFPLPATQETLADVLGLSVVHINRTLQELRRQGLVALRRGHVHVQDRRGLELLANYVLSPC